MTSFSGRQVWIDPENAKGFLVAYGFHVHGQGNKGQCHVVELTIFWVRGGPCTRHLLCVNGAWKSTIHLAILTLTLSQKQEQETLFLQQPVFFHFGK